jgi:hypothetical protein
MKEVNPFFRSNPVSCLSVHTSFLCQMMISSIDSYAVLRPRFVDEAFLSPSIHKFDDEYIQTSAELSRSPQD